MNDSGSLNLSASPEGSSYSVAYLVTDTPAKLEAIGGKIITFFNKNVITYDSLADIDTNELSD